MAQDGFVDISPQQNEGLLKKILVEGTGDDHPKDGHFVTVHYVGTLLADGSKFDSSRDRGEPFTFTLGEGRVIQGWDKGVGTMRLGEKAILRCAPDFAYGPSGSPPTIPPNSTLDFEVELLEWVKYKDLTGDKGVLKTLIDGDNVNSWESPFNSDEVSIRYTLKVGGEVVGADIEDEFPVDRAPCLGFQKAMPKMKKGERSLLELSSPYAAGLMGVPEGSAAEVDLTLLSWNRVKRLEGTDGEVIKKIIEEADDDRNKPVEDSVCEITYTVRAKSSASEGPTKLSFTVDHDQAPCLAIDLAMPTMSATDKVVLVVPPGKYGMPEGSVGAGEPVEIDLELHSFTKPKSVYEMELPEKVAAADAKKVQGNAYFKAANLERATKRYKTALDMLSTIVVDELSEEESAPTVALKVTLHSNSAMVALKQQDYRTALTCCEEALKLESTNVKSIFRQGLAHVGLMDYNLAMEDFKQILQIDPQNRDALSEQRKLKKKMLEDKKREQKAYANMFERMAKNQSVYHDVPDTSAKPEGDAVPDELKEGMMEVDPTSAEASEGDQYL